MNYFFSFTISNNQQEYAACMIFMQKIKKGEATSEDIRDIDIRFMKSSEPPRLDKDILALNGFMKWDGEQILPEDIEKILFIFHINCSNEDDIVNLLYYCLIKQQEDNCILCTSGDNLGKMNAVVPAFLYYEIEKSMRHHELLRGGGSAYLPLNKADRAKQDYSNYEYFTYDTADTILPMVLPQQRINKKFSPLFEIDEMQGTARKWGNTVQVHLESLYKTTKWEYDKAADNANIFRNFYPHIEPRILLNGAKQRNLKQRQDKLANTFREYGQFVLFTECLCLKADGENKKLVKRRFDLIKTNAFYDLIRDVPFLAFYIFCLFDYFSKDDEESELSDEQLLELLREKLFNARDMAEGLLQIIENVYHSEFHKGFFCFRIHTMKEGDNQYLQSNYGQYLKGDLFEDRHGKQHFLEVKVADYSHKTIPLMFRENYKKRMKGAETEEDKGAYKALVKAARRINLRSFFAPSAEEQDFWSKYNRIAENVVHHYGLQVFDSFVMSNHGYFYVQSNPKTQNTVKNNRYSSLHKDKRSKRLSLPGSQYEVLIPFRIEMKQNNTLLNVNINYTSSLLSDFYTVKTVSFDKDKCNKYMAKMPRKMAFQEKKERLIKQIYEELVDTINVQKMDRSKDGIMVLWCPAENLSVSTVEIFCKVMMLYIASLKAAQSCYLMITDCIPAYFVEITRMMALFYDKQGDAPLMQQVQIYLSGKEHGEEFLISGKSLGTVVSRAEKLAFARGIHPKCMRILHTMLKNKPCKPEEDVQIAPFDMIEMEQGKDTLFEKNVYHVLNTDIQSRDFGCKLDQLHVKIGTKIHITTFYEAELLFHNNYYTSRFAYWLAKKIKEKNLDPKQPVVLVGYETYSEMLLRELKELLLYNKTLEVVDCIIYEQKALEKFRAARKLYEYRDYQFLLVAPINSTTTTHNKLGAFLEQSLRKSMQQHLGSVNNWKINIAGNYGVLIIGTDGDQKLREEYWTVRKKNILWSNIINDEIVYFLEVKGTWEAPLSCQKCFPKTDYTQEQPLVETNKESIVPMHAIRLKNKNHPKNYQRFSWQEVDKEEFQKVQKLSEFLIYKHLERNDNHFNYYFPTEKYFSDPQVEKHVIEWLKHKKTEYEESSRCDGIIYNVIVAPLHFSNTAFVNAVNRYFFQDAALVLHFDVEKEYRNNVKTKYSNLRTLYENLRGYETKATINFHFVDDTIVSGKAFVRAHSLIQSMFPYEKKENVKVNVFASIILLLSRLSMDSKRNFIGDTKFFYSYVNLQISSMRNHEDACVLCKKEAECLQLSQQASLNEVCSYWRQKSERYRCLTVEEHFVRSQEKNLPEYEEKEQRQKERAAMRMMCSHRANLLLSRLKYDYHEEAIENYIFTELFWRDGKLVGIEEMISYLKVIARPFISFNKEVKTVIFGIMLKMLHYILMEPKEREKAGDGYDEIKKCMEPVVGHSEYRYLFIKILMNRLVELGSNYMIRKACMEKLFAYAQTLDKEKHDKFIVNFVNRVKRLIGVGNNVSGSLYLEYLLLYNKEYKDGQEYPDTPICFPPEEIFFKKLFLENTGIIIRGVEDLSHLEDDSQKGFEDALNHNYYLESYAQLLKFDQLLKARPMEGDEQKQIAAFSGNNYERLRGLVCLKKQLDSVLRPKNNEAPNVQESENTYKELLGNVKAATGAVNGELIIRYTDPYKKSDYRSLDLKIETTPPVRNAILLGMVRKYHDDMKVNTFHIIDENETEDNSIWLILHYCSEEKEREKISSIYLLLQFRDILYSELYIMMRNVMAFRQDIWDTFHLASNTLLQNWAGDHYFKSQMKKIRAVYHRDFDDLKKGLTKAADIYRQGMTPVNRELLQSYISLTVDSLIGSLNTKILSGAFEDCGGAWKCKCPLRDAWRPDVIDVAADLWKLTLVDGEGKPFDSHNLHGNFRKFQKCGNEVIPSYDICEILILSALQSAGRYYSGRPGTVTIYESNGYLYIKNALIGDPVEIQKKLDDNGDRDGGGISVALIKDVCDAWYQISEAVVYVEEEEKTFVVRLPILEREEKNGDETIFD